MRISTIGEIQTMHVKQVTIPVKAQLNEEYTYSVFAIGLVKGSPALQFVIAAVENEND